MNSEDYMMGWIGYLAGGFGLFLCWFWMTRKLPPAVRNLLRWMAAAVLFTPYTLEPPYESWAPALIIVLFESLIGGVEGAARAGVPLLVSLSAAVIMFFLYQFFLRSFFVPSSGSGAAANSARSPRPNKMRAGMNRSRPMPNPARPTQLAQNHVENPAQARPFQPVQSQTRKSTPPGLNKTGLAQTKTIHKQKKLQTPNNDPQDTFSTPENARGVEIIVADPADRIK